ncbi:ARM repeat-containing protein [Crucibulum laeve]|uniref:ARM repeat-containing protein n=1 Tax=Crucibulum laeve TaxID=68775 RepID=A0A5C3LND1_9AGAR|nr:ARM repeat-containing protein [Crucibulum laeve]
MEAVVPAEITAELTQILSNLVLGDNEIRSNAEKAVNERLAQTPELYLLALAQFAIAADTEVMRSFSLVLLRRLLFRPAPSSLPPSSLPPSLSSSSSYPHPSNQPRLTLYDHLSSQTLTTLERLLLHSLAHEPSALVRRKSVDTVCDLANQGMVRGRPWHALQAQAFAMTQAVGEGAFGGANNGPGQGLNNQQAMGGTGAGGAGLRESAYRVFAGCPNLVMDLQTDAVLGVFQRGLQDAYSIEVRHAALLASTAYLSSADAQQLAKSLSLLTPMLDTLPFLASSLSSQPLGTHTIPGAPPSNTPRTVNSLGGPPTTNYHHLSTFLSTLTPLCSTHPTLFAPHLQALLSFLPGLILPAVDCGPTPTVGRPFPSSSSSSSTGKSAFVFPPPGSSSLHSPNSNSQEEGENEDEADDADERATLRLAALEFMISLSEAKPGMVRKVPGWVEAVVRACLEGMGEVDEDDLEGWLKEDPSANSSSSDTESAPALYEQSLDRLACAMGGRSVLPPAFQYIPSMMASYDWRVRHAGLMAIAAIAEGTGKVMQNELGKIVDMVTPMFTDSHPRVRYAACQCVGQLCTDLEEIIQERYHQQLFAVLIPTLEDPEPRVHSHAAAALINFCEGVERDTLIPYLDPIVERLLKLLNPGGDQSQVRRYVQEQAITTLAMVADASEATFAKHYPTIMPLLLNVLRNAEGPDYRKLRVKAMECAGLIAIAVGRDVFRPDSSTLVELLMRIQKSPVDPNDTQVGHYLIATWAKVCQAMGHEFEPYLPAVMPALLATASAKADISVYDEDEEKKADDGWETISMDGQTLGIRTSAIEEKCQAFETLVIYCSTLGPRFAPYLAQTLEVTLPSLRFYFHDGVREACAMLIPMLLACGKQSGTLTNQMVAASFHQVINCINTEHDSSFLASLYKCFTDSLRVIGGPTALAPEFHQGIVEATKRQLQALADKRKARQNKAAGDHDIDKEDLALYEEMEDFALEDMGKMLSSLDPNHPLLMAVSGVRDLGFNTWDSDEEGDEEG